MSFLFLTCLEQLINIMLVSLLFKTAGKEALCFLTALVTRLLIIVPNLRKISPPTILLAASAEVK